MEGRKREKGGEREREIWKLGEKERGEEGWER